MSLALLVQVGAVPGPPGACSIIGDHPVLFSLGSNCTRWASRTALSGSGCPRHPQARHELRVCAFSSTNVGRIVALKPIRS
jgi:hypothetical protein